MARVFPASQHPLIRAVLNRLIPAEGGFPGAGDLDLLDHLDRAACTSAETQRAFVEGMRQIGIESGRRYARDFEALAAPEQDAVLGRVEGGHRAFFAALVSQVYQGYYSHPAVVPLLGLEARPPQPQGHTLPPFDVARTRAMSERGALYRQA
jgi:hypothetical protein